MAAATMEIVRWIKIQKKHKSPRIMMSLASGPSNEARLLQSPRYGNDMNPSEEGVRVLLGRPRERDGYESLTSSTYPYTPKEKPPLALQDYIPAKLWKRFSGHMSNVHLRSILLAHGGAQSKDHVSICNFISMYVWSCWFFFYVLFLVLHVDETNHPVIFWTYCALTLVMIGNSFYNRCYTQPNFELQMYSRVVDKMTPSFLARGLQMQLGSFRDPFYFLWQRRYYVAFHRLESVDVEQIFLNNQEDESEENMDTLYDEVGPFIEEDWHPLQGTWIRTAEHIPSSHTYRPYRDMLGLGSAVSCCFKQSSEPSLTWVFENKSTTTFRWERTGTVKTNLFWCMHPKAVVTCHEIKWDEGRRTHLNMMEHIPSETIRSNASLSSTTKSRVQEALRVGTRLVPLLRKRGEDEEAGNVASKHKYGHSSSDARYYLHGEQGLLRVTDTSLQKYEFSFLEDMPSHHDILYQGALEQITTTADDEDCMVLLFERVPSS